MNHCDSTCQSLSHCGTVLAKTPYSFWNFTADLIQCDDGDDNDDDDDEEDVCL